MPKPPATGLAALPRHTTIALPTATSIIERIGADFPGLRILPVPAPLGRLAASLLPWLHARSRGRVPLLLSPYRWRSSWRQRR